MLKEVVALNTIFHQIYVRGSLGHVPQNDTTEVNKKSIYFERLVEVWLENYLLYLFTEPENPGED